jgi:predicted nucleotide-binding protein
MSYQHFYTDRRSYQVVKKISSNLANGTGSTSVKEVIQDSGTVPPKQSNGKRSRVSQSDVPWYSLEDALRIPRAIGDHYAFKPTRPLDVAAALGMQPTTSGFRMLTGSAVAYGLTEGGYGASLISVTQLARRILQPLKEGDDIQARREAFLMPRVLKEFLAKYDNNKFPREDIAKNVLFTMGVPKNAIDRTLKLLKDGAKLAGFLKDINGTAYVNLQVTIPTRGSQISAADVEDQDLDTDELEPEEPSTFQNQRTVNMITEQRMENRRVFITHGKNTSFVEPLKELLAYGELEPIVSVERESVSQPIPDKVMNDMRSCSAAIIHIEDEQKLIDSEGNQHIILNSNVLIEIGAAIALYGRKFILLVKSGVKLPSNLQGLYEVRYEGDKLDYEATIRLLKAIRDIKNHPLPTASV